MLVLLCLDVAMPVILKNHTYTELADLLAPCGVDAALARRIQAAVVRRSELPPVGPGASGSVLKRVELATEIPTLELAESAHGADGFTKYLLRGADGQAFEAVAIPLLHRAGHEKIIVCVSCQVGCAMGCCFCATGALGWTRDLAAWEIVEQVRIVRECSDHPVRGVVFMGMGEPMLNYDAVMTAAAILSEPCGMAIAAKAITVSTVGIVPGIQRFTTERQPYRLVVSLTSADPERREKLLPVEAMYSSQELIAALRAYHTSSGQRVTLAWTMASGVNVSEQDAIQLAALTRHLPLKLDLIDVNDPSGTFRPPSDSELDHFRDMLRKHVGCPVARRYSGGKDINAACGMLAATPAGSRRDFLANPRQKHVAKP